VGGARDTDRMIEELASHSAELSALLHETVSMLAGLVAAQTPPADREDGATEADPAGAIPPDVLEIATLQATAMGLTVEDFLREAVLAHAARATGGEHGDRPGDARADALRLRAENHALRAQNARIATRAAEIDARAKEAREAARVQRERRHTGP
jgi:hypothetical protein